MFIIVLLFIKTLKTTLSQSKEDTLLKMEHMQLNGKQNTAFLKGG